MISAILLFLLISYTIWWISGTPQYSMFRILSDVVKVSASDSFLMQDCVAKFKNDADNSKVSTTEKCNALLRRSLREDQYVLSYIPKPKNQAFHIIKMIFQGGIKLNNGVYNINFECEKHNKIESTCHLGGYEAGYAFGLKKHKHVYMLENIEISGL